MLTSYIPTRVEVREDFHLIPSLLMTRRKFVLELSAWGLSAPQDSAMPGRGSSHWAIRNIKFYRSRDQFALFPLLQPLVWLQSNKALVTSIVRHKVIFTYKSVPSNWV